MEINIMVIGKIIILMELENFAGQMAINIVEIGEMEKSMDKAFFITQMEIYMMASGLMI